MLITSIFSFSFNIFYHVIGRNNLFQDHVNCLLQQLSIWSSPKFCRLIKIQVCMYMKEHLHCRASVTEDKDQIARSCRLIFVRSLSKDIHEYQTVAMSRIFIICLTIRSLMVPRKVFESIFVKVTSNFILLQNVHKFLFSDYRLFVACYAFNIVETNLLSSGSSNNSITLSLRSPGFYLSAVQILKILWEKEKSHIMSNFSFYHSVFYPFGELLPFSSNLKLLSINSLTHYQTTNFRIF